MERRTVAQFANRIKRVLSPTLVNDLGGRVGFRYLRPTRSAGSTAEGTVTVRTNRAGPDARRRSTRRNAQKSAALGSCKPGKPVSSTARPNKCKVLTHSGEGLGNLYHDVSCVTARECGSEGGYVGRTLQKDSWNQRDRLFLQRNENPHVGGSIPPLATNSSRRINLGEPGCLDAYGRGGQPDAAPRRSSRYRPSRRHGPDRCSRAPPCVAGPDEEIQSSLVPTERCVTPIPSLDLGSSLPIPRHRPGVRIPQSPRLSPEAAPHPQPGEASADGAAHFPSRERHQRIDRRPLRTARSCRPQTLLLAAARTTGS